MAWNAAVSSPATLEILTRGPGDGLWSESQTFAPKARMGSASVSSTCDGSDTFRDARGRDLAKKPSCEKPKSQRRCGILRFLGKSQDVLGGSDETVSFDKIDYYMFFAFIL
jgi:hypothetical protein